MKDEIDSLLRALDRRQIQDWIPELRLGKPAYDVLLQKLDDGSLTENQTRNALHALFRIRGFGDETIALRLFAKLAVDPREKVRTEAVKLVIGLLRLRKAKELPIDEETRKAAHDGWRMGVEKSVSELAESFFGGASPA